MKLLNIVYKIAKKILNLISSGISLVATKIVFNGNTVSYSSFHTNGIPYVMVARGGKFSIGKNFAMNNGIKGNPIGCYERCTFFVDRGAVLTIGDNVGMSQAALICHKSITIGNNVKIYQGVTLGALSVKKELMDKKRHPTIEDDVTIYANATILGGETVIGRGSVIGGNTWVTKSVPAGTTLYN